MYKAERVSAVVVMAVGVFVAFYSYTFLKLGMLISPGAGFLPFLLGIALIVLGTLWFLQKTFAGASLGTPAGEREETGAAGASEDVEVPGGLSRKMLVGIVVMFVYALLFERIGYFLGTLFFMSAWQILVEREKWLKSGIITVIGTFAMYTLFRYLLGVYLPGGTWF